MPFTGIDDNVTEYGDIVASETALAIMDNLNYLIDSVPPGKIIVHLYGLAGVPAPDPEIWQLCDGSAITNPLSPLRGSNTPNYADNGRMMVGAASVGTVGNYGGERNKNLAHDHGGATAGANWTVDHGDTDESNDEFHPFNPDHTHTISSNLSAAVNFDPVHIKVRHYIKIR